MVVSHKVDKPKQVYVAKVSNVASTVVSDIGSLSLGKSNDKVLGEVSVSAALCSSNISVSSLETSNFFAALASFKDMVPTHGNGMSFCSAVSSDFSWDFLFNQWRS